MKNHFNQAIKEYYNDDINQAVHAVIEETCAYIVGNYNFDFKIEKHIIL